MQRVETDEELLARAAAFQLDLVFDDLDSEKLREISSKGGIDFATAFLFDRVCRSSHRNFIQRIDDLRASGLDLRFDRDVTVGIVPAAFYKEKPHTGADGHVIREATERSGIRTELIPLNSVGTLAENSGIILEWLEGRAGKRIIIISLCKGAADLKTAFNSPSAPHRFQNVEAWINVCGTANGSAIAQWMLATKFRFFASWLFFKSTRCNFQFLQEIVPSATGSLAGPIHVPSHVRTINVVGFPLRKHLSNGFMRRCHALIGRHGPNDGGVLLAEACHAPGCLYPVWGADHYLQPKEVAQEIILTILAYLMSKRIRNSSADIRPKLCPAT
jgi:hypothetical protein